MTLIDPAHPFFRPLWRRVAVVTACFGWALFEIITGSPGWAMLFGVAGLYAAYVLLIAAQPEDKE
ncbi:MAG: hypothetical protein WBB85_01155 [Albidovulum sp.]|uniref:hypothetical protein n=1 Tax=Albidovulum sp. TaxID=1872424 RepID=UPI003C9E734B